MPIYNIDQIIREAELCRIGGWCVAPSAVRITVLDGKGKHVDAVIDRYPRTDVPFFTEENKGEDAGFTITIRGALSDRYQIIFESEEGKKLRIIRMGKTAKASDLFTKTVNFIKKNGIGALPGKMVSHIKKTDRPIDYMTWRSFNLPGKEELERQKKEVFDWYPKFSIVVPLYKTPENYLKRLIDSVKEQTYSKWELCLSDGSGADSPIAEILKRIAASDERIKYIPNNEPLHIAENTNRAIEAATGDYIAFADHDDELSPDALYECAAALNKDNTLDILYSDEDKTDETGRSFFEPHMKPEFNPDLLRTVNYICHLFVVRRSLLDQTGFLNPEFDGAQDYDLILRCTEKTDRIKRIPKVLYHWRSHSGSTSEDPESKRYAFDAGRRALEAHFARIGLHAEVSDGEYPGLYRTKYIRDYDPLVSILIPNKDHIEDLKRCMRSIDEKSTYRNYEYIIIENNSEKEETFAYYKLLEAGKSNVKVVYYDGSFNFSDINNFGEKYANGEYLLFLNNDIEMIAEDSLEDMLGFCMRKDVGAVGARLYFEDDTIQHAGVVIGFGGIAGHCFVMQPKWSTGYMHRIISAQDYSAVTAACMLVDRRVFHEAGCFTTELAVAFNDIDLCMKIRQAGYLIVYDPYAVLYHYESKSRGKEDTPEKKARFAREIAIFKERWPKIFEEGDPYYNPNLTLESQDFSLKR